MLNPKRAIKSRAKRQTGAKYKKKKSYKYDKQSSTNQRMVYKMRGSVVKSPFPPNFWTEFTYSLSFNVAQALPGIPQTTQFRMNGPYDPVVSAGGGQPRYWDSLMGPNGGSAPYRSYRCHASKIEVIVFPQDTTAVNGNALISLIPQRAGTTAPTGINEMRERPFGKYKYVSTVSAWKPHKMTHFTKTKTHLGHKDLMDVDATASAYNNVPTEEVYWNISQCSVDPAGTCSITYTVTITYFVQCYGLADVADS